MQELHEALQAKDQAIAQLRQQVMVSEDSSADEGGNKLEQANRRISNLQAQVCLPSEGTCLTRTCSGARASATWCPAIQAHDGQLLSQSTRSCAGPMLQRQGRRLLWRVTGPACLHVSISMLQAGRLCHCPVTLWSSWPASASRCTHFGVPHPSCRCRLHHSSPWKAAGH